MSQDEKPLIPQPKPKFVDDVPRPTIEDIDAALTARSATIQPPTPVGIPELTTGEAKIIEDNLLHALLLSRLEFFAKHFKLKWKLGEDEVDRTGLIYVVEYLEACFKRHIARRNPATTTHIRGPVQGVGAVATKLISELVHEHMKTGLSLDAATHKLDNQGLAQSLRETFPQSAITPACVAYYKTKFKQDFAVGEYCELVVSALGTIPVVLPECPGKLRKLGRLGARFTAWLDDHRSSGKSEPYWTELERVLVALTAATNIVPMEQRGRGWLTTALDGEPPKPDSPPVQF